jgi:hypothetical protein
MTPKKMKNDGALVTQLAGTMLRLELDRIPRWKGDHVSVRDLTDWFAQYLSPTAPTLERRAHRSDS